MTQRLAMASVQRWFQRGDHVPLNVEIGADRSNSGGDSRRLVNMRGQLLPLHQLQPTLGLPFGRRTAQSTQRLVDVRGVLPKPSGHAVTSGPDPKWITGRIHPDVNHLILAAERGISDADANASAILIEGHRGNRMELRPINTHAHLIAKPPTTRKTRGGYIQTSHRSEGTGVGRHAHHLDQEISP